MQRLQTALTKQLTDEHERIDLKLREKVCVKPPEINLLFNYPCIYYNCWFCNVILVCDLV